MTQQEKAIIEIEKIKEWFIRNSKHDCNNNAVLMDYTIPSVISLLDKQIKDMKMAKIEEPQSKRWKLNKNDIYWFVGEGSVWQSVWYNDSDDKWRYLTGNCFQTKEEAEEYKKQIEYTARYKNYIEEHSEPVDWGDDNQAKYYVCFMYSSLNKIHISYSYYHKLQGIIYASSEQIIEDAIKEIGEDNFKKYVLGVK